MFPASQFDRSRSRRSTRRLSRKESRRKVIHFREARHEEARWVANAELTVQASSEILDRGHVVCLSGLQRTASFLPMLRLPLLCLIVQVVPHAAVEQRVLEAGRHSDQIACEGP